MSESSELDQPHERLLRAGLALTNRRPRDEVVMTLLGAIGWLDRLSRDRDPRVRGASSSARDHAIEAVLWTSAGVAREDAAGALLLAMQSLDTVRARVRPQLPSRTWNQRLTVWQMIGGSSARTHLLDRLLETVGDATAPVLDQITEIVSWDDAEPLTEEVERVSLPLELVVRNGRESTVVPAAAFRAIEQSVRWVTGPIGLTGVVGGRPFRVLGSFVYGERAVRFHWLHDEVLVPFGTLRVQAAAQTAAEPNVAPQAEEKEAE